MKKKCALLLFSLIMAVIGTMPAAAEVMNSVKGTIRDSKTGQPIAEVQHHARFRPASRPTASN